MKQTWNFSGCWSVLTPSPGKLRYWIHLNWICPNDPDIQSKSLIDGLHSGVFLAPLGAIVDIYFSSEIITFLRTSIYLNKNYLNSGRAVWPWNSITVFQGISAIMIFLTVWWKTEKIFGFELKKAVELSSPCCNCWVSLYSPECFCLRWWNLFDYQICIV